MDKGFRWVLELAYTFFEQVIFWWRCVGDLVLRG